MRRTLLTTTAVATLILTLGLGWRSHSAAAQTTRAATRPTSAPTTAPATPTSFHKKTEQIRGFSMQLCDASPEAIKKNLEAIDELANMGCTWINFVVSARQDNARSESISIMWENTPSRQDIEKIFQKAKSRGMGTMLMPIVLLVNSGSKDWRGVINPPNWDNWWASYTAFITEMAALAQRCGTDVFCVGSELLSTEEMRPQWVDTIALIRKEFHGKLTYSANWDHYTVPKFWDQVDYIGMNNYNELIGNNVADLNKSWLPLKKAILDFAETQNKPFMFTEVGWHNLRNTLREPWNYVAGGEIDQSTQKMAYQSFVDTWGSVPNKQFMGAFIWEWRPGTNGATEHGTYSLQGTYALEIVKEWMQSK